MQRSWSPGTWLEIQGGAATSQNSLSAPQGVTQKVTTFTRNPTPGMYPETQTHSPPQSWPANVCLSIIYSSQKAEITQGPTYWLRVSHRGECRVFGVTGARGLRHPQHSAWRVAQQTQFSEARLKGRSGTRSSEGLISSRCLRDVREGPHVVRFLPLRARGDHKVTRGPKGQARFVNERRLCTKKSTPHRRPQISVRVDGGNGWAGQPPRATCLGGHS